MARISIKDGGAYIYKHIFIDSLISCSTWGTIFCVAVYAASKVRSILISHVTNGLWNQSGILAVNPIQCTFNSMGDCDGATHYVRQRSFPMTAFDLVTMVSLRDLQPLL